MVDGFFLSVSLPPLDSDSNAALSAQSQPSNIHFNPAPKECGERPETADRIFSVVPASSDWPRRMELDGIPVLCLGWMRETVLS